MATYTIPPRAHPGLTPEEMKTFVRNHFEDFVNGKRSEVAFRSFSHDFLDHDEPSGVLVGPQAAKALMEGVYARGPDIHVTIEDILSEDDKVMVRNTWQGTEAASGRKMEFKGFVLWRFAHGKIVERWATVTPPQAV